MTQEVSTATPQTETASPATAAQTWVDTLQDASLKEFAINKGYHKTDLNDAVPNVLRSYQNMEKLLGAEKAGRTIEIPDFDNPDAAESRNAFYNRLGRPLEPKGYDLGLPETGVDPSFEAWARETFHGTGLTGQQANAIGKAWSSFVEARTHEEQMATQQRYAEEDRGLRQEWGAAYNDKLSRASAAAKAFGISGEAIDALQSVAGYGEVMRHFAAIAEAMGEHSFVSGESSGEVMTPHDAKQELNRLVGDAEWMKAWTDKNHPKHKDAVARHGFLASLLVAGQ
jgi:hypothetical protein